MFVFIMRRLSQTALVLLVTSLLVFAGLFVVGDPVEILISPDADQIERDRARVLGLLPFFVMGLKATPERLELLRGRAQAVLGAVVLVAIAVLVLVSVLRRPAEPVKIVKPIARSSEWAALVLALCSHFRENDGSLTQLDAARESNLKINLQPTEQLELAKKRLRREKTQGP